MTAFLSKFKRGVTKSRSNPLDDIDMYIDLPHENTLCSGTLRVEGWAFSTAAPVIRVQAWIGDRLLGDLEYGFERPDVVQVFPQTDGACGFKGSVRLDGVPAGSQQLVVRVTDHAGNVSERGCPVNVVEQARTPTLEKPQVVAVPRVVRDPDLSRRTPDASPMERSMLATQPAWPDGHFYSPVVNIDDVWQRRDQLWPSNPELLGIEFHHELQRAFLTREFGKYIGEYDYPDEKPPRAGPDQFYTLNSSFGLMDSRSLFVMLRNFRPRNMIEVGSGFSSLLTADVNRRFLGGGLDFTCIEPYPNPFLLRGIPGISRLIQQRVEDVPISTFERLGNGDILFIDSSHVSKTGSDVNYIVFEILPRLRPGTIIHFHDIPFPHEYPREWVLNEGRSWNELYVVRALLMFTNGFEFVFGSSFVSHYFRETVEAMVGPKGLGGGSIWLRRLDTRS